MSKSDFARICKTAGRAVRQFNMIEEGDRILIGLSGGKDSTVLSHTLAYMQRRAPIHFELRFVTFDPGFPGMNLQQLTTYCQQYGWQHTFERLDMPSLLKEKQVENQPCSFCARMRRGKLYAAADRLGCNKLALGQHLDDLCASLLISLFRGHGIKTMGPNVPCDSQKRRVIRPLCTVREDLIARAAQELGKPDVQPCEYEATFLKSGDRARLQQLVNDLDQEFNGIRENMLASMGFVEVEHLLDQRFLGFETTLHAK
jgi:tRNA 2-thiocytidine biosynthesis protein TtcA